MASIKMPRKPKMPKMPKSNTVAAYEAYIKKLDALHHEYCTAVAMARKAQAKKIADKKRVESLKKSAQAKRSTFCKVK